MNIFKPVGSHGQTTDLSSANPLTKPSGANAIQVQVQGASIRYTLDGTTTPTATKGFQLDPDAGAVVIDIDATANFNAIQVSASATLDYQWGQS